MKPVKTNGFTIVETMLFLGITGLLIMGILVGTGTSINIQRYRDSVSSLQSFLQQQYSNVANVSNDVMTNKCNPDGSDSTRGQSDCVILGKYIVVDSADNTKLNVKNVLGTSCKTSSSNDIVTLQDCKIVISLDNAETYEMEWGSSAVKKADHNPMVLSMLILRSPSSGMIRTFVSGSPSAITDNNIQSILSEENPSALQNDAKICVDSNGLFTGNMIAVQIDSNSTSASGVETLGDNSGC
jgi:type II secretory pathway pseudopilin PulG